MGCDCNSSSLLCSTAELAECSRRACEEGKTLTNWWQSRSDADACAQKWTKKTGIPHYITADTYAADEVPISVTLYTMESCPLKKVYDAYLESNKDRAETCANKWNELARAKSSPIHYEAKKIGSRFLFADIWKVVVRQK